MLPPELSLRSPLPSPLATNNSPPEGPMRFAKMVFLVNVCCAEASTKAPSTRKNAVTVIPSFVMEVLPSGLLMRASYASPALDTTNLPREQIIASSIGPRHLTKRFRIWRRGWDLNPLPLLNTRNLLILLYAQYAKNAQAPDGGTRRVHGEA